MNARFTSYFTRHMPVALHARLKRIAEYRNSGDRRRVTLEDVINEALELGVERMEADQPRRRWIDWSQTPDHDEQEDE